ncbi:hypothetical protein QM012_002478 [Aureobasidium pullulans]|uniref:Uncharacterized protein n=1 Tax=Aureobasidium pullulans TaxID=5580 RepID=A0ABR0TC20_AURPU
MSDNINNTAAAGQRITFGTELEFIAIVPRKTAMRYGSAEGYVRSHLSNAQVKLACNKPGCKEGEHSYYLPIHDDEWKDTNDKWILTRDQSVGLPFDKLGTKLVRQDLDRQEYGGLELISRVQKFEGSSPCPTGQVYPCTGEPFEWSWRDELRYFLEALHEAFSEPGFCLLVNETTGLHVHLGHRENGLPLNVVQGLLGTMTALERCFDELLPTNRISGATSGLSSALCNNSMSFEPLPGIRIDGFHALYKPGVVDSGADFTNTFCPAISKTMFQNLHKLITKKAESNEPHAALCERLENSPTNSDVPVVFLSAETAKSIEEDLLSFNIPSWLKMIEDSSSIEEIKAVLWEGKYTALSVSGLGVCNPLSNRPPTAEVRTHAGSLDFEEISAWVDLLCSLTLWSEIESKETVFSYLLESWRDAEYNICTLARKVGAAESTVRHYAFVLHNGYAQHRFEKYTSPPLTFTDNLENLNRANEEQRRKLFSRKNVDEKIRWKLESGRYGPLLTTVLEAQTEPEVFSRSEAKFLHYNEESQKAYAEFLKNYYRGERNLKLTSKDSTDDSGASSDVSSDASPDGGVKVTIDSVNESMAVGADNGDSGSSSSDESNESDETEGSDDFENSANSEGSNDDSGDPVKSPIKNLTPDKSEDDFNDEGWYGLHPGLANAYNDIPGQHLTHLENTVHGMPALPSPTTPNMLDFEELKTDTVARIHNAFFSAVTLESLAAAESTDEVENIIARAVETQKQMHVLKSVAQEKVIAKKYLNKMRRKE